MLYHLRSTQEITFVPTAAAAFISYSREDSDFALRLAQDLKSAGAAIWLDQVDINPVCLGIMPLKTPCATRRRCSWS